MVEKPANNAPSNYAIIGRYILTPTIYQYLQKADVGYGGEIQLTDGIKKLAEKEKVLAYMLLMESGMK